MVRTKKKWGQHFLHDRRVIDRINGLLQLEQPTHILEVGPGPGTLTLPLLDQGHQITAVEMDEEWAGELRYLSHPALEVHIGDFMDWNSWENLPPSFPAISNLPYNVSVPITARLLEQVDHIPQMVLMYQKEVAQRVRARPQTKDYGPISVMVQQFYDCSDHFDVGPGAFKPPPKVVSQVIRLERKSAYLVEVKSQPWMRDLLRDLFCFRRKMILGVLKRSKRPDKADLLESFARCGFDPKARPEQLSPADYAQWYKHFQECHEKE